MRASDLLGRPVRGADGRELGRVVGIRVVQDGPVRGALATLRVDAVTVSRRRFLGRLGYEHREQRGPWLLGALMRHLHRHSVLLPWAEVAYQLAGGSTDEPRRRG